MRCEKSKYNDENKYEINYNNAAIYVYHKVKSHL